MDGQKIGYVTWWFTPRIINESLSPHYFLWPCQLLRGKDFEVDVLTGWYPERGEKRRERIFGLNVYRYRLFGPNNIPFFALRKLLREKYDLIHVHTYGFGGADLAFWSTKMKRVPLFFTPHCWWHDRPLGIKSYIRKVYDKKLGRKLVAESTATIAFSEYEKKKLKRLGANNIVVVPHGVDLKVFNKSPERDIKEVYDTEHLVLSVGMLDYRKGHDVGIRAFKYVLKEIPDAKLLIVGGKFSGDRYPTFLKKLVYKEGLTKNVLFLGYASRDFLIDAYLTSSVFALPTRFECFGIVFIEAMAASLPIITTKIPPLTEIIGDGEGGILVNFDPKKLSEKIILLLQDRKMAKKLGNEGRKRVEERFDLSRSKKILRKLYDTYLST